MDELRDKIFNILLSNYNSVESKALTDIMEEIEMYDNSCSMANEYNQDQVTEMKKIIEDQRKQIQKYINIMISITTIMEGFDG